MKKKLILTLNIFINFIYFLGENNLFLMPNFFKTKLDKKP